MSTVSKGVFISVLFIINLQRFFYTPKLFYTIMFVSIITKIIIISFNFNRAQDNRTEHLVVVHLLDTQIKRNLKGFLCSLANQYMLGTLKCLAEALSIPVEVMCLCIILLSAERIAKKVEEFEIFFLITSM